MDTRATHARAGSVTRTAPRKPRPGCRLGSVLVMQRAQRPALSGGALGEVWAQLRARRSPRVAQTAHPQRLSAARA